MHRPIIADTRAPARPSIHIIRLRRVCTAARYLAGLVLGCVGTAASGSLAASTRAPLLRWSLGPRCLGAGVALAARVPVLTSSSARRPTPSVVASFISDSAATTSPPSSVPNLARDRLDHPLAAAIRLIYAARPTWPVGYARLRRSREDRPRVQRASPPIEHRAAAASPRRAAVPPPRGSPRGCIDSCVAAASPLRAVVSRYAVTAAAPRPSPRLHRLANRRCVAPSGRNVTVSGPRRRPEVFPPSPRPACRNCVAPSGRSAAARGPLRRHRASTSRGMRRAVSLGAGTPPSAPIFVTLSGFFAYFEHR
uniref:Uncharacterized protein n=1 Tax=Aegilops tauschii subsp. strangulata TaxID=200361 RepID=A0A453MJB9_AEGTS